MFTKKIWKSYFTRDCRALPITAIFQVSHFFSIFILNPINVRVDMYEIDYSIIFWIYHRISQIEVVRTEQRYKYRNKNPFFLLASKGLMSYWTKTNRITSHDGNMVKLEILFDIFWLNQYSQGFNIARKNIRHKHFAI